MAHNTEGTMLFREFRVYDFAASLQYIHVIPI